MVDGGWMLYHGAVRFNPDTYPDPVRLFDKLHGYGWKSLLWFAYFVSPLPPAALSSVVSSKLRRSVQLPDGPSPARAIFTPEMQRRFVENAMPMSVIGLPEARKRSM